MDLATAVRARVDATGLTGVLVTGDLAAIATFVLIGEFQHARPPLSVPGEVAQTVGVFAVGWLVVAVGAGLYTRGAVTPVQRSVLWTVPAWIVAVAIALGLRALPVVHGDVPATFAAVAVAVPAVLLVGWRLAVGLVVRYVDG